MRNIRGVAAALSIMLVVSAMPADAQIVAPAAPPIGDVLKEMPRDLWHFLSWDTATVVFIGAEAAAIGHRWDDDLADEVATNVQFNASLEAGHKYGAFTGQVLIGAGIYATGWIAKNEKLGRTGGDILRAQLLSQLYVQAIKFTVQRERPDGSNNVSFPSGHSASAFATAGVLQRHYGWKAGVPAHAAAMYVAFARVHDNHHYLSDVIFGAAMGVAGQRTVTLHAGRYGVDLAPITGGGRRGVSASVR